VGSVVNERVLRSVWSFFFLYVMITGFCLDAEPDGGYDLFTFATVAALNNMGLGFGNGIDVRHVKEEAVVDVRGNDLGAMEITRC
jgi:Trk-type K+ transport system membrane component